MEIVYKKDGNQKFMIIRNPQIEENDYKMQMISNNNIKGVIAFKELMLNNKIELWYDVTSLSTLENTYSRKMMTGEEIENLIKSIKQLSEYLKEYLLSIENILFSVDMVFVKKDEYRFCYCPEKRGNFQDELRNLFDAILAYIDHKDKKVVEIAYKIQQITISEEFSINDLVDCVTRVNEENLKNKEREESICEKIGSQVKVVDEKKNIFQKVYEKLAGSRKYEIPEEVDFVCEESTYNYQEKEPEEDMTMLLTSPLTKGIILKSLNIEEPLLINPKTYPCIVGNSIKSSDIHINSRVVSRVHMRIIEEMQEYYIEDLNSTNGTYINEKRIKPHQQEKIEVGDVITIANLQFMVE